MAPRHPTSPISCRPRLSEAAFAERYGAAPEELGLIAAFLRAHAITIDETNAARRTVVATGTVAQMSKAFAVTLGRYHRETRRHAGEAAHSETFRGREGPIHVPGELAPLIVGVFGLDNRRITKRNAADPPNTTRITVPNITGLYRFPANSAAGQTIAIFSERGYRHADIAQYYATLPAGFTVPTLTDVSVDASNNGSADGETTQDICIAATAAPGAAVAVYFTSFSQVGWVDLVKRVVHPSAGDPVCSVLSSSFYVSNGDDLATLSAEGITVSWLNAVTASFQDAAIQGVTVCIASGDTGTDSKVGDGKAHVQYPGSDPWVLSVGGTTVGNVSGATFDEWVWNDASGATGGGVSDFFPKPPYQTATDVPLSLNDTHAGRAMPDVAANASPASGYPMIANGLPFTGNGTSASAPLWAGLVAVLNAALGFDIGFANPAFYAAGSTAFRDILANPGAADNGFNAVAGYPARIGWDACTGWGSPAGTRLLAALAHQPILATAFPGFGNFGTICPDAFHDEPLTIDNSGFGLLEITSITSSSPAFLAPEVASFPLIVAVGSAIDVIIRFAPTAFGPQSATITIFSNDPSGPHKIAVVGNAPAPRLVLAIAGSGAFHNTCVGSFSDAPLLLSNSGHCRLAITGITSSSSDFIAPEMLSFPLSIGGGDALSLPIRFQPASFGAKTATLTVFSNDPAGPRGVALSGIAPHGRLSITGSTLFGGVKSCTRAQHVINVCNTGECDLHVSHFGFRHRRRCYRLINNPFPATLRPGSCLGVVVQYRADEKIARGCELVIRSDDPQHPVRHVEVSAYTIWECCEQCGKTPCCCEPRRCCDEDQEEEEEE
jgi:kumamolisin